MLFELKSMNEKDPRLVNCEETLNYLNEIFSSIVYCFQTKTVYKKDLIKVNY